MRRMGAACSHSRERQGFWGATSWPASSGRSPCCGPRAFPERTGLADRVDALLDWFGLESCRERIDAVEVDLRLCRLGPGRRRYDTLCPLTAGIIHCASDTRFSERCRRESMDINVAALHGIVTLARDAGAGCFHYVSTAYVCPTSPSLCAEVPAGPGHSRTCTRR